MDVQAKGRDSCPLTARQAEILGIIQEYYAARHPAHGATPRRNRGDQEHQRRVRPHQGAGRQGAAAPVLSGPKRHTKYVPVETRSPVLAALERLWEAVRARGHAEHDASELREAMSEAKAVIEVARKQKGGVT